MIDKYLLKVRQLSIAFPKNDSLHHVVNQVDLEIGECEVLGLVGESGSGKSLTALSLMGLLPKQAIRSGGEIHYQPTNQDLCELNNRELERIRGKEIGMIFQEPMSSLNPVFKAGFQIEEALLKHQNLTKAAARKLTYSWMERVGLKDLDRIYQAYPHQLSGGQKQRIMIAMAMCCQPKILIADEPTTALDVTVQKKILSLLLQLKNELGTSILFISHDLAVVGEIADRVMVMREGKIVETGPTHQLFSNPQMPYTRGLLACKPILGKQYHRLPTIESYLEQELETNLSTISVKPVVKALNKTTNKQLLEVKNLSVYYQKNKAWWQKKTSFQAVKAVSFWINSGETLGLVGESGCGKSTLGKALAQLQQYEGTIIFDQIDYENLRADKSFYRSVQIIFQDPYSALNPRLPVGEAIMEPMRVHGLGQNEKDRKVRTIQLLERVGLSKTDYYKYPHQFSGGQRQRVAIARALSVEPRFIICDEVVSALDVSVQAQVLNLLKDLQSEYQLTYLFISHDLAVVQFMSDRIAVMEAGQFVELAETNQIYSNPQHPYTRLLIEAIPG